MRYKPNILLILADDMGFSDIGSFGAEIHTPNLDRLALNGLRMTNMYNCARCCPSRASLLTGLYPHQAGIGHMTLNKGIPSYQGYLREDCVTLGEILKSAGYFTVLTGKWHVGGFVGRNKKDKDVFKFKDPYHPLPTDRGFDRFYGNPAGGGSYFNVWPLIDQDRIIDVPEGFYSTDNYTLAAIRFIEEAVNVGKPFFVHVCYNAPHWPLHAPDEDIMRYRGTYVKGWDNIRMERYERLKDMGIIDSRWIISPRDTKSTPWDDVKYKDWEDARMSAYAAQIDRMDQNIGKIIKRIEELGILDRTLIIFVSDNGGSAEHLDQNTRAGKELSFTRDGRPVRFGNIVGLEPGKPDTFMSYDLSWANASNTPFRKFKSWVHEGGIATPFIAYWQGVIPAGRIEHAVAHFIDIAATIIEIAGACYPEIYRDKKITPLEGESFASLLEGKEWERKNPLAWEHEGNCAVRWDRWKLVKAYGEEWELYDMIDDRTELNNLASCYPDIVRKLSGFYDDWVKRCGVMDWDMVRKLPVLV